MAGKALATVASVFGDMLGLVGVPTGTATQLLQSVFRRRAQAARDIFLDEMRDGEKTMDADEVEEAVTVVYHYLRAAQEGSARANLRMMARVIDGQARRGRISADEFLPYASILTTLREAEVVLLGTYYRHWMSDAASVEGGGDVRAQKATLFTANELVPDLYPDKYEVMAAQGALIRTGFFRIIAATNGDFYAPTRFFLALCEVAPFEAAPHDTSRPA